MNRPLLITTAFMFLVACLCNANENLSLNYTCAKNTLNLLNNFGGFIMVPACKVNKDYLTNTFIVSNCSKGFSNGEYLGYVFNQSDTNSELRTFRVNCSVSSNGTTNLSTSTNISITKVFPTFDFTLTVGKGNTSYNLGQEIPVILTAAEPYLITPTQCIAESSEHPDINIILWQNGTTQQQYLLTNFSAQCNRTLTAKMYGFRFLNSYGIRLTCGVKSCLIDYQKYHEPKEQESVESTNWTVLCINYLEDEPMDENDVEYLSQTGYSEDDDYLGQIPELSLTRTITIIII